MERTTSSDCQQSCFNSTTQPMTGCICVKSITYSSTPALNSKLHDYIINSLNGIAAATDKFAALGTNITGKSIADFLQENSPENTLALVFLVATALLQDQRVANSVASTLLNRNQEINLAVQHINSLGNSFLSSIASAKQNALKQNIHKVGSSSSGSSSSGNTQRTDKVAVLVQAIIDIIAD